VSLGHFLTVFQAIVLNRITHAIPVRRSFRNIALSEKPNVGCQMRSYRYMDLQQLFDSAMHMHDLFTKLQCPDHCLIVFLHALLAPRRDRWIENMITNCPTTLIICISSRMLYFVFLLSHHTVVCGICSLLCFCLFFLYGYGFLSGGKRLGREVSHACSTSIRTGLLPFL